MFRLVVDKRYHKLTIEPMGKMINSQKNNVTEKVTRHNDIIYVCLHRKPLKEKATEIKDQWIKDIEKELEEVKNTIIKTKY